VMPLPAWAAVVASNNAVAAAKTILFMRASWGLEFDERTLGPVAAGFSDVGHKERLVSTG
jgi:hypothetical protein